MSDRHRPIGRDCALTLALLTLLAGAVVSAASEPVTLSAEIEIGDYDEEGNVLSVMVYDDEWGSVLIADEGKGKELRDHIGEWAMITGEIEDLDDDSGYAYLMRVTDYVIEDGVRY